MNAPTMKLVTKKLSLKNCVFALSTSAFALVPLMACAEEGHHAESSFGEIVEHLWPYFLNFALYVGALIFLLKARVATGWHARRSNIEIAVNKGKVELAAANALLADAQEKLRSLESDKRNLEEEIRRESQEECADILTQANERAVRIREQALEMSSGERKFGEKTVHNEIAASALQKAEQILTSSIDEKLDGDIRRAAFLGIKSVVS